jgi:hypothetical protein
VRNPEAGHQGVFAARRGELATRRCGPTWFDRHDIVNDWDLAEEVAKLAARVEDRVDRAPTVHPLRGTAGGQ